jgi:hypothetical protein
MKKKQQQHMIKLGQKLSVKNMKNKRHVLEDGWFVGKWATSGGERGLTAVLAKEEESWNGE